MKQALLCLFLITASQISAQSDSTWTSRKDSIGWWPTLNRIPCQLAETDGWKYAATIQENELPDSVVQRTATALGVNEENILDINRSLEHRGEKVTDIRGYEIYVEVVFPSGLSPIVPVLTNKQGEIINTHELETLKKTAESYNCAYELLQTKVSDVDSVQTLMITYDCESQRSIFNFDLTEDIIRNGIRNVKVRSRTVVIEPEDNDVSITSMEYKRRKYKGHRSRAYF